MKFHEIDDPELDFQHSLESNDNKKSRNHRNSRNNTPSTPMGARSPKPGATNKYEDGPAQFDKPPTHRGKSPTPNKTATPSNNSSTDYDSDVSNRNNKPSVKYSGLEKRMNTIEESARARKRWRKVGVLAIALNRFSWGVDKQKEKRETHGPKQKSPKNEGGYDTVINNIGRKRREEKEKEGKKKKKEKPEKGPKLSKEEKRFERIRLVQPKHRKTPGPTISESGEISGRGVHKVRWKEKLRGVSIVTHNILLGGRDEANDKKLLDYYGVTHVLNSCKQLQNFFPKSFEYLKVNAVDSQDYDITRDFEITSNFLRKVEDCNGRVLVHCIAGVSRSVCVILMHLMSRYNVCLNQAYKHVKDVRPFIHPNEGFLYKMALFEVEHFGYTSIAGPKAGKDWNFYEWNKNKKGMERGGDEGELRSTKGCCVIL